MHRVSGMDLQEGEGSRGTTLASTTGKRLSLLFHRGHGGANLQGTSEEGCWVMEERSSPRRQAGDRAGDWLESLLRQRRRAMPADWRWALMA